jgi:nitrogen fixation NifU-like protein
MSDLRELYQDTILDHAKKPRNFGPLPEANRHAEGYNPLCGDKVALHLRVEDGTVRDARFEGSGCAISTASASLLTEVVRSKSIEEVEWLNDRFHALVTAPPDAPADASGLGKLAVFSGVREFPVRVKCAILVWHSLRAALHGDRAVVSTE